MKQQQLTDLIDGLISKYNHLKEQIEIIEKGTDSTESLINAWNEAKKLFKEVDTKVVKKTFTVISKEDQSTTEKLKKAKIIK